MPIHSEITKLPLKSPGFPDTVLFKPPSTGYLYKIHSKSHKLMDILISRVSHCECEICKLNDADWKGTSVSINWIGSIHHIIIVLCPNGAAYELKQWVYSYPDQTKLLVNGLQANKRLVVDGKTTYSTFEGQARSGNHVKTMLFTPMGNGSWRPAHTDPPPAAASSSNINGIETAFSVAGTTSKITLLALRLAGVI